MKMYGITVKLDAQMYSATHASNNTGASGLPDIHICTMPEDAQHPRASVYISGKAQVPVL